jgi:hypothetical protein
VVGLVGEVSEHVACGGEICDGRGERRTIVRDLRAFGCLVEQKVCTGEVRVDF